MNDREKLFEVINEYFGCDAAYFDVDPWEMAHHLITHGLAVREKGEWIMRGGKRYCPVCGQRACVTRDSEDFWYTVGTDFCPNCGADMRKGDA